MADTAPANVVADRYLASPAGLRARPAGPVDALDTHAGRASQVRLVFLPGAWEEAVLADAVARWCAIGCAEVCGVLDVGRHGDVWYLALPPSLGVSLDRWRTMRLPGPADAARLTLGCGRLLEVAEAAGFPAGLAGEADLAVGPGPTPFLDRPLLPYPGAEPAAPPGGGQRLLARVLDALTGRVSLPPSLAGWRATAAGGGFGGLSECLDALEHAGAGLAFGADDPPGVAAIFADESGGGVTRTPRGSGPRRRRAAGWAGGAVAALAAAAVLLVASLGGDRTAQAAAPAAHVRPPAPSHPLRRSRRPHRPARAHRHAHPQARSGHHARNVPTAPAAPAAPAVPAPPPAPAQPSQPAGTVLPAPGGTVLPAP